MEPNTIVRMSQDSSKTRSIGWPKKKWIVWITASTQKHEHELYLDGAERLCKIYIQIIDPLSAMHQWCQPAILVWRLPEMKKVVRSVCSNISLWLADSTECCMQICQWLSMLLNGRNCSFFYVGRGKKNDFYKTQLLLVVVYEVWQLSSQNSPVKAVFNYLHTNGCCHLWSSLLAHQYT
jgi:hypothetical protein